VEGLTTDPCARRDERAAALHAPDEELVAAWPNPLGESNDYEACRTESGWCSGCAPGEDERRSWRCRPSHKGRACVVPHTQRHLGNGQDIEGHRRRVAEKMQSASPVDRRFRQMDEDRRGCRTRSEQRRDKTKK